MTDTLLRVLSNADLDWMIACGNRRKLAAGHQLVQPSVAPECLSVVIEGSLGESFVAPLGAVDEAVLIEELGPGQIVGIGPLLDAPSLTAVTALKATQIVSLSIAQLAVKLREDVAFAAHLHHAIARLLANRLRRIFERPDRGRCWGEPAGHDVLTVFGQLRDSDIDWLTAFGQIETIAADRVLLPAARPVESLYILLEGQMAMSASQAAFNPLAHCFLGPEQNPSEHPIVATLSQGSMPGIMSFLDFRPLPVTVRATTEALVFAVPRQTLATKLQVDDSFASRFYRVIAMQILAQLQTTSLRLADPGALGALDDEELDMDDLHQVSEGAKKFGWMLAQLGVNHHG
ncbi:MAG TPA: cyclic nucleotide-binding domain-containing protein [Nodosilinea sp.]|nr:cyclic nucleotide-binding domain-containing protein [Nodosilinea sp.]